MEEIKVGEYCRTKKGRIGKVLLKQEANSGCRFCGERLEDTIIELNTYDNLRIDTNSIYKHSFNIIDLIEEGDYVNGHLVHSILIDSIHSDNDFKGVQVESDYLLYHTIEEKDIKTIVTKEQFNSIKYVIGE